MCESKASDLTQGLAVLSWRRVASSFCRVSFSCRLFSRHSCHRQHEPGEFRGRREAGVTGLRATGLRGPPLARAPHTAASGEGTELSGPSPAAAPPGSARCLLPLSPFPRLCVTAETCPQRPPQVRAPRATCCARPLLSLAHAGRPQSVVRGRVGSRFESRFVKPRLRKGGKPQLAYCFVRGEGKVRTPVGRSRGALGEHVFAARAPRGAGVSESQFHSSLTPSGSDAGLKNLRCR